MAEAGEELQIHDDNGALTAEFVQAVSDAIDERDAKRLRALVKPMHVADIADLIEFLRPAERPIFVELQGRTFDPEVLPELDEAVRDVIIEHLPNQTVATAAKKLETDDAVYLLEDLDEQDQQEILSKMPKAEREAVRRSLDYEEGSAGRLMQSQFVAVPAFWSVGQTIDYMRTEDDLPNSFSEIFVIDLRFHLVGTVPVSRLLRTKREVSIEDLMDTEQTIFNVDDDREDVAYKFEQYNLVSAAVVDVNERLVGMITIDDVVDVIREATEEDMARMAGLGDEEITDTVFTTTKARFIWLFVNLLTAVLASWVISLFDATIEQMVALAILMPIVASMGGNAGTQTMTVAVRAIATRDLGQVNAARVIGREATVGIVNGAMFALIMGAFTVLWFGSEQLGIVIGIAMIVNLIVAALAGILIPLTLDRMDVDPAIASSVFVTTVTDVVGFFAFLGLAALWLV
ncbi:MAG: magnesium transporter [Pseudomonadota bacterium]